MAEARVALITGMSAEVNRQIAGYAPDGFTTNILSNDAADEEKIETLKAADFLLIHPGSISERALRAAPKLKLVQLLRMGYELIDLKLLRELGVPFATIGYAMSGMVADHAVMLMLAVCRNLMVSHLSVMEGSWGQPLRGRASYEMEDKTVGILGLGNIGRQVARRVQGFGCRVQYYSRRRLSTDEEHHLGVRFVDPRELFATSDIFSLHVPITPETRHIVGRAELQLMKPSAVVVNTSRGEVIDEPALIEALQQG